MCVFWRLNADVIELWLLQGNLLTELDGGFALTTKTELLYLANNKELALGSQVATELTSLQELKLLGCKIACHARHGNATQG